VFETVTPKCSETLPSPGTENGPLQDNEPPIDGLAVVAPVVLPGMYENPAGSVSEIEVRLTALTFGLFTVIV
jgi:hypothetical protein